jgi:hypothetical protein
MAKTQFFQVFKHLPVPKNRVERTAREKICNLAKNKHFPSSSSEQREVT